MAVFSRSNNIILADPQAMFRAGTAKLLAKERDLRIVAQCTDLERMYSAITTSPGSTVLFATSLQPDLPRLCILLETTGSRGIAIAENNDIADPYLQKGFSGVVFRSVNGPTLVECVHQVSAGGIWAPLQLMETGSTGDDLVGYCAQGRLTSLEMQSLSRVAVGPCRRLRVGIGERARLFGSRLEYACANL